MKKTFKPVSCLIPALIAALLVGTLVYTWQQRELKTALKPYQKTDEQQIIEAAKAYTEASFKDYDSNIKVKYYTRSIKGNFAEASSSFSVNGQSTGGVGLILKKVANQWVVVYSGHNYPPKEIGEKYSLPQELYQSQ